MMDSLFDFLLGELAGTSSESKHSDSGATDMWISPIDNITSGNTWSGQTCGH